MAVPISVLRRVRVHAGPVLLFTALFGWVFGRLFLTDAWLAESDLQDLFLPTFLAPAERWASEVFAGQAVFADPFDAAPYPLHLIFARVVHSWSGYVVSAYVLGASFMYAYVFAVTRARAAAMFAGLAFGLSESMIERQAHINILHPFAWLPLMVLAVDRLATGGGRRWIGIGAVAVAMCLLGGHPQPLLYGGSFCLVYFAAGAWHAGAPARVWLHAASMFALGLLLTGIKTVPFVEAAGMAARDVVGFARFLTSSHTPMQLLGVLFPTIEYGRREAPLYVGLAVLPLALLGVTDRRNWRAVVWGGGALLALLISVGDATPIARMVYAIPLFDRFRVGARVLILFALGLSALAGFGVAALERRQRSRLAVTVSVTAMLCAVAAGASLLWLRPDAVRFLVTDPRNPLLPGWPPGVWAQFGIAVVSAAGVLWMARGPRFTTGVFALGALLTADLLHGAPYPVSPIGLRLNVSESADLQPSVHARRLAAAAQPEHQRLLAFGGTTRDVLVPAGFARLWKIPIAGGYSQVMPDRLSRLASMGLSGDVTADALTQENRALDLLTVRFLLTQASDFPDEGAFEMSGIQWARSPLDLPIGRADCNQPRTVSLALPNVEVAAIAIVAHLRCSEGIETGVEGATVEVRGTNGTTFRRPLTVGVDISERDLSDAAVLGRARHPPSALVDDPSLSGHQSLIRIALPRPVRGGRLVLHGGATPGWTSVERITVIDTGGHSHPQRLGPMLLGDPERWREASRFRTSRISDRDGDEDVAGEREVVVYENRRLLPRAWIVPQTLALADRDTMAAVQHSQLPDGRAFDPLTLALVEPGVSPTAVKVGPATARVQSIEDGRIVVNVQSAQGGFLVLSEMFYPGWQARIGDRTIPVQRTDGALQGVAVPAGEHAVVFELASRSFLAGALLTVGAALITLWLLIRA